VDLSRGLAATLDAVSSLRPGSGGRVRLHTGGVWIFTRFLRSAYPVSKLLVAALVYLGWNYPMNRWVVFNPRFLPTGSTGGGVVFDPVSPSRLPSRAPAPPSRVR